MALIAIAASAGLARAQSAPPAAEFVNGHWQSVAPKVPAAERPDPELDHVEQLLSSGDAQAALTVAVRWVKTHAKSAPQRDRCLLLIARSLVGIDDPIKGYYYLDELMDEYPSSRLFGPALQAQYDIADNLLSGHKLRLLGLPVLGATEEGVEMLFRVQQRAPGSPLAERALLRSADYYYASGDYDLSADAYDAFAKQYPRSERVPQARLRSAFAALAEYRGTAFDATPMLNARTKLADFAVAYPKLAADENVPGIVATIDAELAAKLYATADYYRRTGADKGAVYMYRFVALTYPQSKAAADARAALATMPATALAEPSPRAGRSYVPPAVPRPRVPLP